MSDQPFKPPSINNNRSSAIERRFRTIRFHEDLRQSDVAGAIDQLQSEPEIDNSVFYGDFDAVRLWSTMNNGDDEDAGPYEELLRFILATGGSKFINEQSVIDGLRPIDVAEAMQRCVLIEHAAELAVDLNPTLVSSPLYRGCVIGYDRIWYERLIAATDPIHLDWQNPVDQTTPLHTLCRTFIRTGRHRLLRSIHLLLRCVGFVNPRHICFVRDPIQDVRLDPYIKIAVDAADEFVSVDLMPPLLAGTLLPDPICRLIIGFYF